MAMRRQSDGLAIDIQRAAWKSLQAGGALELPTATMVPARQTCMLAMTRLADLAPLVGQPIAGSAQARSMHRGSASDGAVEAQPCSDATAVALDWSPSGSRSRIRCWSALDGGIAATRERRR